MSKIKELIVYLEEFLAEEVEERDLEVQEAELHGVDQKICDNFKEANNEHFKKIETILKIARKIEKESK